MDEDVFVREDLQVADSSPDPDLETRYGSMDQIGSVGHGTSAGLIVRAHAAAAFERF
jgi:hypothetical protein